MKQDKGDKKELFYSHKTERKSFVKVQLVEGNILWEEKKYHTPKRKRSNKNNINFRSLNKRFEEKESKLKEDEDKEFYQQILHSIINDNSNSIIKNSKNSLLKSNKDNSEKADSNNTFADKNLFKNIKKIDIPNKNIKHLSMEIPNRSKKQLSVKNNTHSKFEKISLSSKRQSQIKEDFSGNNDNPLLCFGNINNKVRNSYPSTYKKKEDVIKSNSSNKLQKLFDDASSCVVENKNSSKIKADLIADIKPISNENENENSNKSNFINNNNSNKSKRRITICCIPFKRKSISTKSYLY